MTSKLLSGRWLLTISAAFVFVWASVSRLLSPAEIVAVIMFVFQSYFNRKQEEQK